MADAAAGIAWLYEFAIEAGSPVEQMLPEVRQWGQRAIDIDDRNSRAWAIMAVAELIGTPSRPRDALVATPSRGAADGPRDAFAVNGIGMALLGISSSLALASSARRQRGSILFILYPPINASETLVYLNRPEEALSVRRECAEPRAGHAGRPHEEGARALIELRRARRIWPRCSRRSSARPLRAAPIRRSCR